MKKDLQHTINAFRWLSCFLLSSMFALPLLTIFASLLNIDFITNGIQIFQDVKDVTIGTSINADQLITASNVLLSVTLLSYVPTLIVMYNRNKTPGGYRKIDAKQLFKCLCLGLVLNLFVQFAAELASTIPELYQHAEELKLTDEVTTSGNPLLVVLTVGIFGPMVEEIIFRRGMQKNLCKINPTLGIIATSVLFGVMHGNLMQGAFAIIMGLGLGYMYYKTDNLWYPTFLHIAVNLSSVLCQILGLNAVITVISLPIVFGVLYVITKKNTVPEELIKQDVEEVAKKKQAIKVKVKKIKKQKYKLKVK